jgi:hypothetical protein
MDHRLRHALDVQSVVMDLLESLDYHVQNCEHGCNVSVDRN